MGKQAFVITGDKAALIANDNCDFRYHATAHYVPVGVQVSARQHDHSETQFVVEDGILEFMIGGGGGMVMSGDFVRVPAGVAYAYRNAGDGTARILMRSVNPAATKRAAQLSIHFAA